jgi:hypothetical protein
MLYKTSVTAGGGRRPGFSTADVNDLTATAVWR